MKRVSSTIWEAVHHGVANRAPQGNIPHWRARVARTAQPVIMVCRTETPSAELAQLGTLNRQHLVYFAMNAEKDDTLTQRAIQCAQNARLVLLAYKTTTFCLGCNATCAHQELTWTRLEEGLVILFAKIVKVENTATKMALKSAPHAQLVSFKEVIALAKPAFHAKLAHRNSTKTRLDLRLAKIAQ